MWDFIDYKDVLRIYRPRAGQFSNEACISAHGGYTPKNGWTDVPNGSIVYFYQLHGSTQKDTCSRSIMRGQSPGDCGMTSMGNGSVWNYHLAHYERDAEQVPEDLSSMSSYVAMDEKKAERGLDTFGYSYRDVISIRTPNLPKEKFPDDVVMLSHIFNEMGNLANYRAYHVCFCRFQLFAPGNRMGRPHVRRDN